MTGFDVFKNATSEMTCAQAYLSSAENAAAEIDRILLAALTTARPAYLTLPTDLVYAPVDASRLQKPLVPAGPLDERLPTGKTLKQETEERLAFVVDEVERLWEKAEDPIIIVDACAVRFGAGHLVEDLVKATGVRWFVTPMGRTILDEDPSTGFGGTYVAQLSDERIRGAVEKTDLAIMVGAMRSDLNTGLWSSKIETKNIVELCVALFCASRRLLLPCPTLTDPLDSHSNCTLVQYATYDKISFHLLLPALARVLKRKSSIPASPTLPLVPLPAGQPADNLTHDVLWPLVGQYLRERDIVVAEVGTAAFGLLTLPLPKGATFVSQVLWGCIGFSIGATLGALLAAQEAGFSRRVVLFVGDGSAQLTVQEVATIVRYGLTPTIVLLNNEVRFSTACASQARSS